MAIAIDNWKRRLLDLTKRNRALHFRVHRVSTVAIVDEQPAEVFRRLSLQGGSMRFRPAPDPPPEAVEAPAAEALAAEAPAAEAPAAEAAGGEEAGAPVDPQPLSEEEVPGPALDFAPYDPNTLDGRHRDDALQTTSNAEQLDRSLRRLDEQSRLAIEEQGVNTLFLALGMLYYTEPGPAGARETFRAPLVLIPVGLARKSARTGYSLKATDDDPLVNPALVEYLRRMHSLGLPDLPDSASMAEDYDLQTFLQAAGEAVASQPGWSVKTDIYLSLFSFQKFVMYKDLEANSPALAQHRLVQQLVDRSGAQFFGLPDDVRAMDLDAEFPPETTAQVVDADSSQLRAMAAVSKSYDLVIEGPPGTGKSQTITNLIAQALAARKSVLFVAEKMAALEVVHRRLVNAGLGEFCLELHSTKANKRAVMKEIGAALDASLQRPSLPAHQAAARLPGLRQDLTEYANTVHAPHGALGLTPYQAYGELGAVIDAPRLSYSGPTDTVGRAQLDQAIRELTDLAQSASGVGPPAEHPWRDTSKTFYSESDLEAIRLLADDLAARLEDVLLRAREVEAGLSLPPIRTFGDIDHAAAIAAVIARSPGAPLAVLQGEAWNTAPRAAGTLLEHGRSFERLNAQVRRDFTEAVLERDHAADIAYIEKKSQGLLGWLAFLDPAYGAIQQRWLAYRLPHYRASIRQQAEAMKNVVQLKREQQALAGAAAEGQRLFGSLWQGEQSRWDALENYIRWILEFREVAIRHGLTGRALEAASQPGPDMSRVTGLQAAAQAAQAVLANLRGAVGWPADYAQSSPLDEITQRARALAGSLHLAPRWAAFESARAAAAKGLAADMLAPAMSGEVPFDTLPAAFRRAFYQKWLAGVVQIREPLRAFHSLTHEQRIAEFRALDQRVLAENRTALVAGLREEVQKRLQSPEVAGAMPFLRRELARQRGLSPLRKTMKHAEAAIRAIKPCFMMSPLSVAQLLDGAQPTFDLVIFDEASQLPTEDAVGAILRGRQLVVVGDPKQLPPTNFFAVMSGQVAAPLGEDGLPLYEDSESVLEEFMGTGLPASRLKWHYRSTHESLIAFSNASFYDSDLHTFPSVETQSQSGGVQFEFVEDGLYEGKGLNMAEARRVADAVVAHARVYPDLSLGVGTFNLRQQIAIQDELEQRRRQDPGLEPFFAQKDEGTFFVKNLENIQGDERDVIFISVTYAKGPDGRLRYQFGPLNMQNGWRRLNVLVTRARKLMRVFASIHGEDFNLQATASLGAKLLRSFLIYAEHGRLENEMIAQAAETESPLERDIYTELTRRGLMLRPQVGVSGYRIDFGVIDPALPGRYVAGLECDGRAYHAAQTARDRDRLRQQVLEARGWSIHRIWSTDWFKDRAGQAERLLGLVAGSRELAQQEAAEKRAREDAEARAQQGGGGEAAQAAAQPVSAAEGDPDYVRPLVASYRLTAGEGRFKDSDLLQSPPSQLQKAVLRVAEAESPVHLEDVVKRVAGMWEISRLGTRIRERIEAACREAAAEGLVRLLDDFVYGADGGLSVRSRAGTGIPPERISPEEYREAVLLILGTGHGFSRAALVNEVRALFGYGRTTEALQQAVDEQVGALLAEGRIGEGSAGLTLRR